MKASWICTQTDVIANFGVIVAALMVYMLQSAVPDLLVAIIIAFFVLSGAIRILRLRSRKLLHDVKVISMPEKRSSLAVSWPRA